MVKPGETAISGADFTRAGIAWDAQNAVAVLSHFVRIWINGGTERRETLRCYRQPPMLCLRGRGGA